MTVHGYNSISRKPSTQSKKEGREGGREGLGFQFPVNHGGYQGEQSRNMFNNGGEIKRRLVMKEK